MFEAYITNTALYPLMGIEVGTTVHFPMTTQELQAALAKIGIDGKRYSEVFFTSFDSDVLGLYDYLYECENIDELNELGHALLEVRDKGGLETFEAALVLGNHTRSVKDLINLTQNLDLYRFYPDISDDEGLGRLYADELGTIDIPEHIQNYHAAVKHTELGPEGVYRYYSTQRPVDIGTYPKLPDNQPLSIVNYDDDRRRPVADGRLMAWGELTYAKPLTEKQMEDYELKPAPGNPDRVRPSITARLKDGTKGQEPPKEPGQKRSHKKHEER